MEFYNLNKSFSLSSVNMAEIFVRLIELEGVNIKNRNDVLSSIDYEINRDQFLLLRDKDLNILGFVGYDVKKNSDGVDILVNNALIFTRFRRQFNFLKLRKFFKNKYGSINKYIWKNDKKEKNKEFIQGGK